MRKMRKYAVLSLLTLSLLLLGVLAITQIANGDRKQAPAAGEQPTNDDPWQEISKVVDAYYQEGGISYKGTMKLIDDNVEEDKVLEESLYEYSIYGNDYHYRIGELEMVHNNGLLLAVDHPSKTIALSPSGLAGKGDKAMFNLKEFKALMSGKKATARVSQDGTVKIITVENIEDPNIQGYRIYYAPDTYRIQKLELGMVRLEPVEAGEQPAEEAEVQPEDTDGEPEIETYQYRLLVSFTSVQHLDLKKGMFQPERKFLEPAGNGIQLTAAFKDYSLLNAGE